MGVSRRQVLQAGVGVALASSVPLRFAGIAGAALTLSWFSRSSYALLAGTPFSVTAGGTATSLKLVGVRDLTPKAEKKNQADGQFSLLFSGPAGVTQGTYTVRHLVLGSTPLLVVPIGPKQTTQSYEVIVNRV